MSKKDAKIKIDKDLCLFINILKYICILATKYFILLQLLHTFSHGFNSAYSSELAATNEKSDENIKISYINKN